MDRIPKVGDVLQFTKKHKVNSLTKHRRIVIGPKTKWLVIHHSYFINCGHVIQAIHIKNEYDPNKTQIEFNMGGTAQLKQIPYEDLIVIERYKQWFYKEK